MPKVSHRCRARTHHAGHHHDHDHHHQALSSAPLMAAAPRKVSFEDNFPEVETTSEFVSAPTSSQETSCSNQPLQRKSTLARPKSSMSLVELAQSVEMEEEEDSIRCSGSGSGSNSPLTVSVSAPVSPLSSPRLSPAAHNLSPSSYQLPSSPWGQFVEMASSEEDEESSWMAPGVTHTSSTTRRCSYYEGGPSCHCSLSCRRRRASPYGGYPHRTTRSSSSNSSSIPRCFSSSSSFSKSSFRLLARDEEWTDNHNRTPFRLAPRSCNKANNHNNKPWEPTEQQLIGALDRLQVLD